MPQLKTIKNAMQPTSYGSLSPDDMKNAAKTEISRIGLNAMTRARGGTGQRAPMPKPRRQLFTQKYYKSSNPHPDYVLGDMFGVQTRKEETSGPYGN